MDILDFREEEPAAPRRNTRALVLNILTALVLLCVVGVAGVFLTIFLNPSSGLNPFPPPTLPVALEMPTATPTPLVQLPDTWTPAPTTPPLPTSTIRPTTTWTPPPTLFSTGSPTVTLPPEPSATIRPGSLPFALNGKQVAIANIYHPDLGCNWMGVAGEVKDLKGSAIAGQQVQLGGTLAGSLLPGGQMLTLTGLLPDRGAGYYEFTLAEKPVASRGTLWVQLLDQAGLPMSDRIYFDTFEECDKNLVLVNFKQIR